MTREKQKHIDYISRIRKELLSIENNAKNIDGLTESQWVAIRATHRLLGEYIEKEQEQPEMESYELAEKDIIDYACYELEFRLPEYLNYNGVQVERTEFIKDFRKAIEE